MLRMLANGMLTCTAIVAMAALAHADDTVIEHRVESAPPVERRVEEHTVTQEPATVKKRTETVVTTGGDNDNAGDNDNDDDNDND